MSTSSLALPSRTASLTRPGASAAAPGRHPVTAYRVTMGIGGAFWALVLTVSGIVELLAGGYVAGLSCLISGLIAGWNHDRVRTGRAERLALITIPVPWSSKRCQDDRATAQEELSHE